jgi:hypothetical protein
VRLCMRKRASERERGGESRHNHIPSHDFRDSGESAVGTGTCMQIVAESPAVLCFFMGEGEVMRGAAGGGRVECVWWILWNQEIHWFLHLCA